MKPGDSQIGVGATRRLTLRVSVAALVRMLFDSPDDGRTMLALERTATVRDIDGRTQVVVRAKPFGGAARLVRPEALKRLIGDFHYDSERSRQEEDFRIQVRPSSWDRIKQVCWQQFRGAANAILDPGPERELAEELQDNLNVRIAPGQYSLKPGRMVIQDFPGQTENVRAPGLPTVRVYYVFEVRVEDPAIVELMLVSSRRYSDDDLRGLAREDAQRGGRGRANAVLALGLEDLQETYRLSPERGPNGTFQVSGHQLEGTVLTVLQ
jgi:hypothetical protein